MKRNSVRSGDGLPETLDEVYGLCVNEVIDHSLKTSDVGHLWARMALAATGDFLDSSSVTEDIRVRKIIEDTYEPPTDARSWVTLWEVSQAISGLRPGLGDAAQFSRDEQRELLTMVTEMRLEEEGMPVAETLRPLFEEEPGCIDLLG